MLPSKWLHIYSAADAAWKLFGKGAPVSWQTSDPGIEDDLPKISATPFLFTARPKKMEPPFFWWVGSQPTYLSSLFDLSGFLPTAVKFFNAMTRFARFESLNQTQFSDEVCLSSSIIWDKSNCEDFLTVHALLHPLWLTTWLGKHWNYAARVNRKCLLSLIKDLCSLICINQIFEQIVSVKQARRCFR